jgi:hypothetical protein
MRKKNVNSFFIIFFNLTGGCIRCMVILTFRLLAKSINPEKEHSIIVATHEIPFFHQELSSALTR